MIQESVKRFTGTVELEWSATHITAGVFVSALIKFSAAPTTSEDLTITFISAHGTDFNTIIYQVDPSENSDTDIAYSPSTAIPLTKGDKILLEYPNSDDNTIGVTLKGLDSSNF